MKRILIALLSAGALATTALADHHEKSSTSSVSANQPAQSESSASSQASTNDPASASDSAQGSAASSDSESGASASTSDDGVSASADIDVDADTDADASAKGSPAANEQGAKKQKGQKQHLDAEKVKVSEEAVSKQVTDFNKASKFMGMEVRNLQNEAIGRIEDLVIEPKEGKIAYVVMSHGGLLGLNEKLIALPINSFAAKKGENYLLLNATKDQLASAPGFNQNNWPDLDEPAWGGAASAEQGAEASTETSEPSK